MNMWAYFFGMLVVFSIFMASECQEEDESWDYEKARGSLDPKHWYLKYEHCQGSRQSPVNIDCAHIVHDEDLEPLIFINYDKPVHGLLLHNDGHTIKIDVPQSAGVKLRSDTLPALYRLTQFHFHWGTTKEGGSEHRIQSKRWPLEMHLVHVDEGIPSNETLIDKNGLVVVSVLFDQKKKGESSKHIDAIDRITGALPSVRFEGQNITLYPIVLRHLLPFGAGRNYLRYSGSLTTPPCAEVVEWFIMTRTMTLSQEFLYQLRSTRQRIHSLNTTPTDKEPKIKENDRPLQPLLDRPVRLMGTLSDLPGCRTSSQFGPQQYAFDFLGD